MQLGAASITDYLKLIGVLRMPLEFAPGGSYHYSNPGYSIVGYLIEKVGGNCWCAHIIARCVAQHGMSTARLWGHPTMVEVGRRVGVDQWAPNHG
jgi:D-alanyl-D-alanine carboxypeptidase